MKIGFDHKKYLEEQSKYILERVEKFDKLYLEFGGKLMGDLHAKRILPGFDENAKIKVLQHIKDPLYSLPYFPSIYFKVSFVKSLDKRIESVRI